MAQRKTASTSAKILYRPVGLVSGMFSGAIAGMLFKQVWKRASSGSPDDPPEALNSRFPLREVLVASAIQGALYALVKAAVDRGGAVAFERATGEWPGN